MRRRPTVTGAPQSALRVYTAAQSRLGSSSTMAARFILNAAPCELSFCFSFSFCFFFFFFFFGENDAFSPMRENGDDE